MAWMMWRLSNLSTRRPASEVPHRRGHAPHQQHARQDALVAARDTRQHHTRVGVDHQEPAEGEQRREQGQRHPPVARPG